jgi:hypothetical protein
VLGDVPGRGRHRVEAFFPPDVVRTAWEEGRALVAPPTRPASTPAVRRPRRSRFADDAATAGSSSWSSASVDAAPYAGLPLFVGWRALERPTDAPGRLGVLLNCLREHRGSVHAAAVAAVGLGPLEAIVAGSYGEANARFFEWPEPYPDPDVHRARWDAAEDLTAAAAGLPYDALTSEERGELVTLLSAALAG